MIEIQIHFASTVRVALQHLKIQREPLCISAVRSVKKVAALDRIHLPSITIDNYICILKQYLDRHISAAMQAQFE